jgi:hypothetical protein
MTRAHVSGVLRALRRAGAGEGLLHQQRRPE